LQKWAERLNGALWHIARKKFPGEFRKNSQNISAEFRWNFQKNYAGITLEFRQSIALAAPSSIDKPSAEMPGLGRSLSKWAGGIGWIFPAVWPHALSCRKNERVKFPEISRKFSAKKPAKKPVFGLA